jgi:GPH family glycoside/pentoside/hexuronide:cation symporter
MIALVCAIPGSREDQERIDCYLDNCEEGIEKEPFFKEFRMLLNHKNFMAYIITFTLYQSLVSLMTGSVAYVAQFVLRVEESDITIIMLGLIIGMIFSMPVWSMFANKTNNDRKTMLISLIYLTIVTGILFFIGDYWLMFFGILLWGTGEGGFWVMMSPVFSNVIDESIVDTKQRKEGIYNGVQTFLGRFALVIQAVTISVVHILTGFDQSPGATSQTPLAILGIQIHFALVPMFLVLIGTIVFWKLYKLTPDKVERNRAIILEENL